MEPLAAARIPDLLTVIQTLAPLIVWLVTGVVGATAHQHVEMALKIAAAASQFLRSMVAVCVRPSAPLKHAMTERAQSIARLLRIGFQPVIAPFRVEAV